MKQLILLLSLVVAFSFSAFSQTKLLDRSVNFSGAAPVITLYLSDITSQNETTQVVQFKAHY